VGVVDPCLIRSVDAADRPVLRLGVPVLDGYLAFVAGRCRPNTVLATSFDVMVFFGVVGKDPAAVTSADVLGFVTAQRHGGDGRLQVVGEVEGVSARSVRRRLSSVSGLFAYLHARGDVADNPVPRGLPTRGDGQGRDRGAVGPLVADIAANPRPGRRRRAADGVADASGPGDGAGDGVKWAASLRSPRAAPGGSTAW
jgi:hypothetical protein